MMRVSCHNEMSVLLNHIMSCNFHAVSLDFMGYVRCRKKRRQVLEEEESMDEEDFKKRKEQDDQDMMFADLELPDDDVGVTTSLMFSGWLMACSSKGFIGSFGHPVFKSDWAILSHCQTQRLSSKRMATKMLRKHWNRLISLSWMMMASPAPTTRKSCKRLVSGNWKWMCWSRLWMSAMMTVRAPKRSSTYHDFAISGMIL